MIKVNGPGLSDAINKTLREMHHAPYIEEDVTAIAEFAGMQVQVVITRDEDRMLEAITEGLVLQENNDG